VPTTWNGVRFGAREVRSALGGLGFEVVDLTGEATQYLWTTARRLPRPGRADTAAIRVVPKAWDPAALDRLLTRLGPEATAARERLLSGRAGLRELVDPFVTKHRDAPPRLYVAEAYRTLLGREPDEGGLAFYAGEIEQGISRTNVVDCLLASAEFDAAHRSAPPA